MGYKISWPTEKCRLCGRIWIIARGQKIGLGKLGYACPHCSDKLDMGTSRMGRGAGECEIKKA